MAEKKVTVRQVRSTNRKDKRHSKTLQALGLGRIGQVREHVMTPSTKGMLFAVQHLVEVHDHKASEQKKSA